MTWKIGTFAAAFALLLPVLAFADEDPSDLRSDPRDHEMPLGVRTRAHLERQRSGDEASEARGLTPPAERRARKRYLRSFEHPIPDLFEVEGETGK